MSWNGSSVNLRESNKARKFSVPKLIPVLAILAMTGILIVCFLVNRRIKHVPSYSTKDDKVSLIPEVSVTTQEVQHQASTEPENPIDPEARPTKVGEVINGYVLLPSGRMHKRSGVVTNSIAGRPKSRYDIFDRKCNNTIARLIMVKPGDILLGTPNYSGRFKQDFIESLAEPIIISKEDTPEQVQLKHDVIATRLELKDAMDRGEDIEQILLDTRKELQELMRVKQNFRGLFFSQKKNCETDRDVVDLFAACNKALEERGIAPLTYGPITKRNVLRMNKDEE